MLRAVVNHVKWHSTVLRTLTTTLNVMEFNLSNPLRSRRPAGSASTHSPPWSTSRTANRSDTTVKELARHMVCRPKLSLTSLMWPWSRMNFQLHFYVIIVIKNPPKNSIPLRFTGTPFNLFLFRPSNLSSISCFFFSSFFFIIIQMNKKHSPLH